jgi:hypothetical protein
MKTRFVVPVIILGIAATLVAFGSMRSKASVDVNEYKNEVFGYSFQYPSACTFGPMPKYCKQSPPEERPQECLCFLDAENPKQVFMEAFLGDPEQGLSLATFSISSYDSPAYSIPEGVELVSQLKEYFSEMYGDIPDEPNAEIGGLPAVELYYSGSPMGTSSREIYFIKDGRLVQISMLTVEVKENLALYELILSSFSFDE